jgi:hypothetical protein
MSALEGGQDLTFSRMPDHVKVTLVDAMALPPAYWPPNVTLQKAETKISSDRSNNRKRGAPTPTAATLKASPPTKVLPVSVRI